MNLAGRTRLKTRTNSASYAPETFAERRRHAARRARRLARLFRARTSEADLGSNLVRDPRDASCWLVAGAPPTLSSLGGLLRFRGLERLSCFEAVLATFGRLRLGASVPPESAVSAISSPNTAATSVSLSTFAAPGVALDSGRSCPAAAISSFSSTPRSTKRS
jgi:hypothetical protein